MRVVVTTAPAPIVTYQDAVAHLRLDDDTSQQTYVESLIAAAQGHIDGPQGWLGRAIGLQTIEARLDGFDCGSLRLPYPPVIAVTSVKYLDAANSEQTIAPAGYELLGRSLVPAFGSSWPSPRWGRETVRVRYQAGYAEGEVPAPIRHAILLMVGDLYASRASADVGTITAVPMATTIENLLEPFRNYD